MIYGERIFTQTVERIGGATVRISLLERDYTGAATRVAADAIPVVVTSGRKGADLWGQLQGTEIEYRPYAQNAGDYDFILGGDETQFKLRVRLLVGASVAADIEAFVYTDLYEENDNVYPQWVSIKGGDGLGRLDQPYTVVGERRSMAKILADCLKKGGDEWPIATFDNLTPEGAFNAWNQVDVDDRIFVDRNGDPFTCKEVVEELIISKGVNITQGFLAGQIRWIVYDRLAIKGTNITYRRFNADGDFVGNTTSFSGFTRQIPKALRGVTRRQERVPRVVEHIYQHGDIQRELVLNGAFEDAVIVGTSARPRFWTVDPGPGGDDEFVRLDNEESLEGSSLLMRSNKFDVLNIPVRPEAINQGAAILDLPVTINPLITLLETQGFRLSFAYKRTLTGGTGVPATEPFEENVAIRLIAGNEVYNDSAGEWQADTGQMTWEIPDTGGDFQSDLVWQEVEINITPNTGDPFRIELYGAQVRFEADTGTIFDTRWDNVSIIPVVSPFAQSRVNSEQIRYRALVGDSTTVLTDAGIIGEGPLPVSQRALSVNNEYAYDWEYPGDPEPTTLGAALVRHKMAQVRDGNQIIDGTFTSLITLWRPIEYKGVTYMPTYVEITDIKQGFYTAEAVELQEGSKVMDIEQSELAIAFLPPRPLLPIP